MSLLDRALRAVGPTEIRRAAARSDQGWDDLRWIRGEWDGPLVLKGVMSGEDALRAVEAGCEGIVVSNHGGRQLDGLPATIDVRPEVVAAVGTGPRSSWTAGFAAEATS